MKTFLSYSLLTILFSLFQVELLYGVPPETPCFSFITIFGNSNLTNFQLFYEAPDSCSNTINTVKVSNKNNQTIHKIILPLQDFQMKNEMMKRDFLELVKADKFPGLIISINQQELNNLTQKEPLLNITLMLAGIEKTMPIACKLSNCPNGQTILTGTYVLNLNDFEISPTLYLGLVRINNDILINFAFNIISNI